MSPVFYRRSGKALRRHLTSISLSVKDLAIKPRFQTTVQQQPIQEKSESMRKGSQKLGPGRLSWTHESALQEVETRAKWAGRLW